ncbi:MAG: ABC transporter permease [Flavobacteriales bacterium]|nr:ABC transporter permease [Flavobacteriales bacterium]
MAWRSIRSTLLRTILTIVIIAVGITALVAILTAIDVLKISLTESFSSMGVNTFSIRNRGMGIRIGSGGERPKQFESITYDEAMAFKERFGFPADISVTTRGTGSATIKYRDKKSNPNNSVLGVDEAYLATSGYELAAGRNFTQQEVNLGYPSVIIGREIASFFFGSASKALDQNIKIASGTYRIIGVLKEKGTSVGMNNDRVCMIPIQNVRQQYGRPDMNFVIQVKAASIEMMEAAIGEATGLFRIIRGVQRGEEDSFEIFKSDSLANVLIEKIAWMGLVGTIIGIITLMGAAIGLMNIMLVAVTERTREIGIRKALGATRRAIMWQFLIETIVICQLGGIAGIVFGTIVGNLVALVMHVGAVLPVLWMTLGLIMCMITGLLAGLIPALKASRLPPIEALRVE